MKKAETPVQVVSSKLNLVDLAGSERLKKALDQASRDVKLGMARTPLNIRLFLGVTMTLQRGVHCSL